MSINQIFRSFTRVKIVIIASLIAFLLFFNASYAGAQLSVGQGSSVLEPIVVTSTRVTRDLSEVPLSISVVGEEEIEDRPLPSVIEYLKEMPGVQITPVLESGGGHRGQYSYSIRGNGPERTLVLVDGVKQNLVAAYYATEAGQVNLDPSEIERIEIIKGPASVLYGSDAIGGVVNIITKKGGNKPIGFSAGLKYDGSNQSLIPRVSIFGSYQGFNYRVSGSGFESQDMVLQKRERLHHSEEHRQNFDVKLGYQWDKGSIDLAASTYSGWQHLPALMTYRIDSRIQIPPIYVGSNYGEVPYEWKNQFTGKVTLNDLSQYLTRLTANIYYIKQARDMESMYFYMDLVNKVPTGQTMLSIGTDQAEAIGGSIQADMTFGSHNLTVGIDAEKGSMSYFEVDQDARKGDRQEIAAFAQDEWKLNEYFSLIYGLRYTMIKTSLTYDKYKPERIASTSTDNVVGSIGLVYNANNGLSARALVSQGFKAPSLNAQFVGRTNRDIPNTNLKPERSWNFEIGARYTGSPILLDLGLFYSKLSDAFYKQETDIPYYRNGTVLDGVYNQIQNSDEATSYGAELLVEYTFEELNLTPYLSMTAMRYVRKYKNGYETSNTGVPSTWGTGGLRWEHYLSDNLRLFTNASFTWSDGFHDEKETGITYETLFYGHGTRTDFVVGVESGGEHKFKAALNFRNIFDQRYEPYGYFQPGFHIVGTLDYEF
ncbi:MAG: TonB-dependent receptor [Deltaproteobacteria bacterium]|jgi:hemoglobin/transferrin/lactoferrin receptor protein|nr:TonB-dependent receptor [Deltaproteobacteria bacterium]